MTIEPIHQTLLNLIHLAVLPGWVLLILAPRWRWTDRIVHSGLYPVLLGLAYVGFLVCALIYGPDAGAADFTTLEGIATIFAHPFGLLTAWVHYLVFDLFVGLWEARDARRRGMSHWALVPCLLLTFLAGPAGLLLYFALRRKWSIDGT
ncbi:ABA4-like family protein [uncultured Algimonas sp.]|uniref:ABA4-like family protein n=1 Tax=uncultured Algimonas sp. TaxID=1547920 RepID=UPI00261D0F9F|nr:ABA4-like family protein [uncultured Algimonas sp.]